uniref:acylphosphatase n=1 Tax=Anopheles atroparvus TaxID=41427 RepID=A0A182ITY8_ANOAO
MVATDRIFIFVSFAAILANRQLTHGIILCSAEKNDIRRTFVDGFAAGSLPVEFANQTKMTAKILACDFEVFGIVQGVFFRKYTKKQATSLGVRGWCMNTADDTVKGQLEGEEKPFNEMKHWLQTKGSPTSRIDKVVFNVPKEISSYSFKDFSIRR